MLAHMVRLPYGEGDAGAGEIGEAGRAMPQAEPELVHVEADRPLHVRDQNTDVGDRVGLGERHRALPVSNREARRSSPLPRRRRAAGR